MNQALKMETELHTDMQDGWRLWRTLDSEGKNEYVLSTEVYDTYTARVMAQAMAALLDGMSAAVLLSDSSKGQFARAAMRHMSDQWPDCRLMARADGAVFVAVCDDQDYAPALEKVMGLALHQDKPGIRCVGYAEQRLPEVRFDGLFQGGADVELDFQGGSQPVLRIRLGQDEMDESALWDKIRACVNE